MGNSDPSVPLNPDYPTPSSALADLALKPNASESSRLPMPTPPQEKSPTTTPHIHYDSLVKGFSTIPLAAGFVATIQGQLLLSATIRSTNDEAIARRAINAFYTGGLVLDIMAGLLGYLTGRWLERLTEEEKTILDESFTHRNGSSSQATSQRSTLKHIYYTWLGLSLFVPMPLLVFGIIFMMAGFYTYIWTQHSIVVAAIVTLAGSATMPFVFGNFYIGRTSLERRAKVIRRLREMQGDW